MANIEVTIVFSSDMEESEIKALLPNIADTIYSEFPEEVEEVNFPAQ